MLLTIYYEGFRSICEQQSPGRGLTFPTDLELCAEGSCPSWCICCHPLSILLLH